MEDINICDIHIATINNSCDFCIEDVTMCNNVYDLHIQCVINNDNAYIAYFFSRNRYRIDTETDVYTIHMYRVNLNFV